jgi:hypothetical protein
VSKSFGGLAAVDHDEIVAQAFETDAEGVAEAAAERHQKKDGESSPGDGEGDQGSFLFPLAVLSGEVTEKRRAHGLFPQSSMGFVEAALRAGAIPDMIPMVRRIRIVATPTAGLISGIPTSCLDPCQSSTKFTIAE